MTSGVGAVGGLGVGMGAISASLPQVNLPAGMGSTGGLHGPQGSLSPSGMTSLSSQQLQQLTELIQGFSSAEILLALMLASAASKKEDKDGGSGGALALLAGMALANQLGRQQSPLTGMGLPGIESVQLGASLNITA